MPATLKSDYDKLGFLSPIDVLSKKQALRHRRCVQDAEHQIGPLHYQAKVHTILRSPYQLATHSNILDLVEQILGADILLYNTTYIIKEANTPAHVSWHQDLTYWGLDGDGQVSVWLALSPADEQSGCMRMIPGSHAAGPRKHDISVEDENNVLFQSQKVHGVNERDAVYCPLNPGQASFHHGWTLHSSLPNRSDDRRIGLNIQYIAPHVRQTKLPGFSALLVRGQDRFHHYEEESPTTRDLDPAALVWREQKDRLHKRIAATA
ncbi:phytanoyl-CoA dioxygenase family protein [Candidatus Spongiihabitans sp.]|uniref:phytanoyl-CoA dioxygenase family protein n=1 Tax=Candidatus Spongiihabitans sp. TaxID=3101308 RepID=UPI003C6FB1A0